MKTKFALLAVMLFGAAWILYSVLRSRQTSSETIYAALTTEWLAHESALVFVGVPLHAEEGGSVRREVLFVQFKIEKILKGPLSVGDVVTIALDENDVENEFRPSVLRCVEQKATSVVFARIGRNCLPEVAGRYEFSSHYWSGVFFPGEAIKKLYDETGATIRTYNELLSRATEQCRREVDLVRNNSRGRFDVKDLPVSEHSDILRDFKGAGKVELLSVFYRES